MSMEYKMMFFIVCSLLTMGIVLGILYIKKRDIKNTKLQNKVFVLSILPYLTLLVLSMDIQTPYKIITFILSLSAGIVHLKIFDRIREIIIKR